MQKQNVKNIVLPHSEAKLELYKGYLEKYIQILVASQLWSQINLYDVFCGSGIYDDGKVGSPILAFESIVANRIWCKNNNKVCTPINLKINDIELSKVEQVQTHINSLSQPENCKIEKDY